MAENDMGPAPDGERPCDLRSTLILCVGYPSIEYGLCMQQIVMAFRCHVTVITELPFLGKGWGCLHLLFLVITLPGPDGVGRRDLGAFAWNRPQ